MKTMLLSRTALAVPENKVPERLPSQPRNKKMDAIARHAASGEAYSFENACKSVSEALRKAKSAG